MNKYRERKKKVTLKNRDSITIEISEHHFYLTNNTNQITESQPRNIFSESPVSRFNCMGKTICMR